MTLRPSRILLLLMVVLHGLAMAGILVTSFPVMIKALLIFLLAAGLALHVFRHLRFDRSPGIRKLNVDQNHVIWVEGLAEEPLQAELKSAWIGPGIGVAAIDAGGHLHRLMWLPDSADRDVLRRWRIWIDWGKTVKPGLYRHRSGWQPGGD